MIPVVILVQHIMTKLAQVSGKSATSQSLFGAVWCAVPNSAMHDDITLLHSQLWCTVKPNNAG
jgi:hypothetical protein